MNPKPRTLLNENLRWFLLAMIRANNAGQMAYSMLSQIFLGHDTDEDSS